MIIELDEVDRAILRILQSDGRVTNADLARQVTLSPPAVHARVRRMEEAGVIQRYVALVDREAIGYELLCLISISMERHRRKDIEQVRLAVQEMPEVSQPQGAGAVRAGPAEHHPRHRPHPHQPGVLGDQDHDGPGRDN